MTTTPDYFALLGTKPQLGHVYTSQDAAPGFLEPVVISDGFWRRNYGSDPNIVERKMRLDNDMYTIVGVMPPGFRHPGRTLNTDVDVWLATGFNGLPFPVPPVRSQRFIPAAIGRLKPNLTVAQAQAHSMPTYRSSAGSTPSNTPLPLRGRCGLCRSKKTWSARSARNCSSFLERWDLCCLSRA